MKSPMKTIYPNDLVLEMRQLIIEVLDQHKAIDLTTIDLRGRSSLADFLVIVSGTSSRHLQTLAEYLETALKKVHHPILSVEGVQGGDWIILDAASIIVHLFRPEVRAFYQLEKMWEVNEEGHGSSSLPEA